MILRVVICTTFLLFFDSEIYAQKELDMKELSALFETNYKEQSYKSFLSFKNEIQEITSAFFFLYKKVFSSQDISNCAFSPSCSVYAVEAIQQKGFLKGTLMASDRLARCNKFSPEQYKIDKKSGLFLDSIK